MFVGDINTEQINNILVTIFVFTPFVGARSNVTTHRVDFVL